MLKLFGNTGVKISAIGQGTGYDYDFKTKSLSPADIVGILRLGIERGITLIDTSEGYCGGRVEEWVGEAIVASRDKVFLATKFSPEHGSRDAVNAALEGSLRRLRTDYIDLYQFHWPNPGIPFEETMTALGKCVKEGKVRFIGAGNFSLGELIKAGTVANEFRIESLQTEFNLFEQEIEQNGVFSHCRGRSMTIIAYSPLDQGRLGAMSGDQFRLLNKLADKYGKTVAQIILGWAVSRDGVVVIPKTANRRHCAENAEAMNFSLSDQDIGEIDQTFFAELRHIPVAKIRISAAGEENRAVYQTLEEALENRLGFVPSPADLARGMKDRSFLKPVRLTPARDANGVYEYDLISGRVRYWAWVIAHGPDSLIPAYVREYASGGG